MGRYTYLPIVVYYVIFMKVEVIIEIDFRKTNLFKYFYKYKK